MLPRARGAFRSLVAARTLHHRPAEVEAALALPLHAPDRDRRILYLHVIGVHNEADAEHQRRAVLGWEARIVRAVGSREQLRVIRDATIDTPRQGGATV